MSENSYHSTRARSCKNCATAKAKCYGFTNSKCERCSRLNKECTMQTIIRRPKAAKVTRTAQIAQLEQKLDGLVSILTGKSNEVPMHDDISLSAAQSLAGLSQTPSSGVSIDDQLSYSDSTPSHTEQATQVTNLQTEPQPRSRPPKCIFKDVFMQPQEDLVARPLSGHTSSSQTPEELLQIFRIHLARQVPFIVIPEDITALELEEKNPYLYRSMMVAASYEDASHQIALGLGIMKSFADAFLMRGEKSLDLMQGLLVFISWYQYHFYMNMQLNNLLSLMNALVVDLRLSKRNHGASRPEVFASDIKCTFLKGTAAHKSGSERYGPRTLEDRRTMLGCFYLSTSITAMMPSAYADPIRFNSYFEECCEVIQNEGGQPNDVFLVHLARLQFLSAKIRASGVWEIALNRDGASSRAPLSIYMQNFQGEFQKFFNSVPADIREDKSFLLHYHMSSMHLYEIGFYMPPTTSHLYPNGCKMRRADVLHCLLIATKDFLDQFLPIPPKTYFALNLVHCGQVMYVMGELAKLSLFTADDWDSRIFRSIIDMSKVEEQIISRMEEAASIFESNEDNGLWTVSARRLRNARKVPRRREQEQSAEALVAPDAYTTFATDNFDFFEDTFWQGMSGDAWQFIA